MKQTKYYLILHKDEWNRMKNVGVPMEESQKTNDYVQSLIEKSQRWINSWPDSVQGHILKREKQRRKQLKQDIEMIKLRKKEQRELLNRNECIQQARQAIFDDSSYGRRLLSAFIESKTLEERDVQLEFQKKIKADTAEQLQRKKFACSLYNATEMENQEKERETRKREKDKEVSRVNRTIFLTQYEDKKSEKERQIQNEKEDLCLLAELKKKENVKDSNDVTQYIKDLEQLKEEQKQIQDRKALREKQEEQISKIWRKYEDRKNTMMKMIHNKRFEKSQPTYDLVKRFNDEKQKRYDDFVNKGITQHMQRLQIEEQNDNLKKIKERKNQYLLMQSNKELEHLKRVIEADENTPACDRQAIFAKSEKNPNVKQLSRKDMVTFAPSNKMVKNLKLREKEPSPWSGLPAVHAQFARHAGRTLGECRYKQAARKVVDDYRRLHGLKPQDLPVDNYF